ncbi:putative hydrolase of the HAD superfamily [Nocardiopsis mwathae]|uniref:Putative hydrolase of the HAD superfamily n=1 Tax=Nocardiopsis mwathae TaxID=1472723 RepID=A0A7W9YGJ8_9ACTN|nr:HAD-IA family hydrolase [Nocardiopsis mwathae]MBB6171760.1 putative hydrolase of the HAD superfamily [Nocardiopsis mwathae]
MTRAAYEAVLCDIDGVLRLWDPAPLRALEREFGLDDGALARAAFAPHRLTPAVTGAVTDAQWRAGVAADLTEGCGSRERAAALVARWSALRPEVDTGVLALLNAVRQRARVVLVSNATTRLEEELHALGLADAADAVISSSRLGVAKPDPAIYSAAAAAAQVPLDACLFVDDTAANVEAARGLGMAGLHYTGAEALRDVLSSLLA